MTDKVVAGGGVQEPGESLRGHGGHGGHLVPRDRAPRVIKKARWTTTQHSASLRRPGACAARSAVARAPAWALGRAVPWRAGQMPVQGRSRKVPLS
eukprot:3672551-Alexandrium_andersonii.AAC.1